MHVIVQLIFSLIFRFPKISIPLITALSTGYYFNLITGTDFLFIFLSMFVVLFLTGAYIGVHEFVSRKELSQKASSRLMRTSLTAIALFSISLSIYNRVTPSFEERQAARIKQQEDDFLFAYIPDEKIMGLMDNLTFSEQGKRIFFLTDPKFVYSKKEITRICSNSHANQGANLLGCYDPKTNSIFLLEAKNKSAHVIVATTAAHELLHAVYSKMNIREKIYVNDLLNQTLNGENGRELSERLKVYGDLPLKEKMDEIYAIVGTEFLNIPDELAVHYSQYFDRESLVGLYNQFKQKTAQHAENVADVDGSLVDVKSDIESKKRNLNSAISEADSIKDTMNEYKSENNSEMHNLLVPDYNAKIGEINELQSELKQLINSYNERVNYRNKEAAKANRLGSAFEK